MKLYCGHKNCQSSSQQPMDNQLYTDALHEGTLFIPQKEYLRDNR